MKATTKRNVEIASAVGIGLAAAAVGAWYLYGKGGAQRRKKVRGWMLKAKGEILEQLENLKELNQASYNRIVDEVGSRYKQAKHIDPAEVATMISELKGHWQNIKKQLGAGTAKKRKVSKKK